jgi:hypothetical protein
MYELLGVKKIKTKEKWAKVKCVIRIGCDIKKKKKKKQNKKKKKERRKGGNGGMN